jgi:hypothetical protein
MTKKCLKCGKARVSRWRNQYANYYDFKCKACGYVWHEVDVRTPRSARSNGSKTRKRPRRTRR